MPQAALLLELGLSPSSAFQPCALNHWATLPPGTIVTATRTSYFATIFKQPFMVPLQALVCPVAKAIHASWKISLCGLTCLAN
jgi:hypothetical protein